jgi:hypothetical protein
MGDGAESEVGATTFQYQFMGSDVIVCIDSAMFRRSARLLWQKRELTSVKERRFVRPRTFACRLRRRFVVTTLSSSTIRILGNPMLASTDGGADTSTNLARMSQAGRTKSAGTLVTALSGILLAALRQA